MKLLLFIALLFTNTLFYAQHTANIQGKVMDKESGELLLYASIGLYKGNNLIISGQTDFDGNYSLSSIESGTYNLQVSYLGYNTTRIEGIKVFAGKTITQNIELLEVANVVNPKVIVKAYQVPTVQDHAIPKKVVTAEDIDKLPSKSISGIVASHGSVNSFLTKKDLRKYKRIRKKADRKKNKSN